MSLLINDLFDTVREYLGGWEEAELKVRFPDSRIYKHYKHFKRELSKVLKQGELSVSSLVVAAGDDGAYLGTGDRKIKDVFLTDSSSNLIKMIPTTRDYINAAGGTYTEDEYGYPVYYWVEAIAGAEKTGTATIVHNSTEYSTLSSMTTAIAATDVGKQISILDVNYTIRSFVSTSSCTVYSRGTLPVAGTGVTWTIRTGTTVCLYPRPTSAVTITIQGEGEPEYETVAYDSDGMLTTDIQSTVPEIFEDACLEYLTWQCKRSAEEFDERREAVAQAQYNDAIYKARQRWGMVAPASFWIKNNKAGVGPL